MVSTMSFFYAYLKEVNHILEQMLDFLPNEIRQAVECLNQEMLYELRIRLHCPVIANIQGKYQKILSCGLKAGNELVVSRNNIDYIMNVISQYSIYSISDQLKDGYITYHGIRFGLAGKGNVENGTIKSLDHITSMCIRFPHRVKGCSRIMQKICFQTGIESVVILSPPGFGKTTFLKDIVDTQFQDLFNLLVIDDRGELTYNLTNIMSDIIFGLDKRKAIEYGIRVLRPDVIMTDELLERDYALVENAMQVGIKMICSAHGTFPSDKLPHFTYFVVLGDQIGKIKKIYGKEKQIIYEAD